MPVLPDHLNNYTSVDIYMPETRYVKWPLRLAQIWDWCTKNCSGKFDSTFGTKNNGYKTWFFEMPEDATAFKLVWQK